MPSVYEGNTEALKRYQPAMAERVALAPISEGWSRTAGAEGSETFSRTIEGPSRRVEWLGGTALPRAAAGSMTADMDPGSTSAMGLGIGTGHEWLALLGKMGAHQALFVFEPDAAKVRMVMEAADLSAMLESGRMVLLVGPGAEGELSDFLSRNIGFDVPTVLQVLPSLSMEQRAELRAAGEAMVRRVAAERTRRGSEILEKLVGYAPAEGGPIVGFPATGQWWGQRVLASALRAAKRTVVSLPADGHASASLIGRLEAVAQHRPAVVQADFFRGQLGGGLPDAVAVHTWVPPVASHTYFSPDRITGWGVAGRDRLIVHSAEHRAVLTVAGVEAGQIDIVPVAMAGDEVGEIGGGVRGKAALVGEVWPIDPLAYGFELPSHQSVWDAARHLIAEDTREGVAAYAHRAGDLLKRAQRRAGVTLEETRILEAMERAFRHSLIRSIAMITLARQLADGGVAVKLIGRGWEIAELGARATVAPFGEAGGMFGDVGALVHADPAGIVDPMVLAAMTRGAAVVSVEHPMEKEAGGMAAMFEGGREYVRCRGKELVGTVRTILQDDSRRNQTAEAGRAAVRARHVWEKRPGV